MKQPKKYKIKDELHELEVMGRNRGIIDQRFCKDSLVVMRE